MPMRIVYSTTAMPTWVRAVMRMPTTAITSMARAIPVAMPISAQVLPELEVNTARTDRPDDFDACHRSDDVTADHQPAGHESEVGVDRPADPLEGCAAVGIPHVQPPVGVGDDEHGDRGEDEDWPTAVGGRRGECRQSQPDRHRRGGGGHADHGVLRHSDRIGLKPCHRDRRGSWSSRRRQIRHPFPLCLVSSLGTSRKPKEALPRPGPGARDAAALPPETLSPAPSTKS